MQLNEILGQTQPEAVTRDSETGATDLLKTKAMRASYFIDEWRVQGLFLESQILQTFEEKISKLVENFNQSQDSPFTVFFSSQSDLDSVDAKDLEFDLQLLLTGVAFIALYTLVFLGSCSPLHCRVSVALVSLCVIALALMSAVSTLYRLTAYEVCSVHCLIPIALVGVGVDDIFFLCSALDRVSLDVKPNERIQEAVKQAGPALTLTFLTQVLVCLIGAQSRVACLTSLCFYTAACLMAVYVVLFTLVLPVLTWDS